ncbi:ABC-three component system middle component 2 [Micromonospora sp. D75]|uniref:ABC-three component system middle component 2 n=1 Tax=Micromonospora sp. D75 TaxID=2824885 RepID=UPI0034D9569B
MVPMSITPPLNSPLEVGLRVVFVLSSAFPRAFDLDALIQLDHALLHTGQNDGPDSIHPELPGAIGELAVKRDLIKSGIDAMMRAGLIVARPTNAGFAFLASENAAPFVSVLGSTYAENLRARANWVIDQLPEPNEASEEPQLRALISRWISQNPATGAGGTDD